ncbi:MAG: selenocysteine-specific translation elongation factor [Anaerolineales bacterium]|jgi:selenocysteine-specific elongation factor|nr:selenocysteine-specific translation elongation factor [Anaerolineales bacterium]HJN40828.1 selenocysteine-specific translation elongation factor [Anaerolineales bacterium]
MHVICTAGHVDHGKSTLVEALTGMHPDRLAEEREREMTIDLGFAWLTLPEIGEVSIVDVPGHRDFIGNMLAGVGAVAAALLVVAADEGIMPQTEEHLAILDLMHIEHGVVALAKTDLAESPEWVQLVADEVALRLADTSLAGARVVPLSALTGEGVPELGQALLECLRAQPRRPDLGKPRLSVDRVFTVAGFGTVVTGTLLEGSLSVGDEVEILPVGYRARIRGLHTHGTPLEMAAPGARVAINMTGVGKDELHRGAVVARPGSLQATRRVDVSFRLLSGEHNSIPLRHNEQVKLFVGSAEEMARVRGLSARRLRPGETGWLQLELSRPVAVLKGDRFILRRPSPGVTMGGGAIVDAHPRRRHRLQDTAVLQRLQIMARGSADEILLQALDVGGVPSLREALAASGLDDEQAREALASLSAAGELLALGEAALKLTPRSNVLVLSRGRYALLLQQLRGLLAAHHCAHPLRAGMPREELKSRLGLPARAFNALIKYCTGAGDLAESGISLRLPEHRVEFDDLQKRRVEALLARFRDDAHNTPSRKEVVAAVGEEVLAALLERSTLLAVSAEVLFLAETYAAMEAQIKAQIRAAGSVTVAGVRDLFGTSRKYALALMEHMDQQGTTVRKGDERVLR